MATRVEQGFQDVLPAEPPIYRRIEAGDDTGPSTRSTFNDYVMKFLANFFFITGLLLMYGFTVFAFEPVYISITMSYFCCLFIYLHLRMCTFNGNHRSNQDPEDRTPPDYVISPSDPPRYSSYPDLRPQPFKVILPSYEEACGYRGPPPKYSSVEMIEPVHRPMEVEGSNPAESHVDFCRYDLSTYNSHAIAWL